MSRLGDAFRALRRHAQPCATCRAHLAESAELVQQQQELYEKTMALYARWSRRLQAALDRQEGPQELPEGETQGTTPTPEQERAYLRQVARQRGLRA